VTSVIWWLRRDLRLSDQPALQAALEHARQSQAALVPAFILDARLLAASGPQRLAFLFGGLQALDDDLRARGSRLIVRQGDPLDELRQLAAQSQAVAVYAESDATPYARRRDAALEAHLPMRWAGGPWALPPEWVVKPNGQPYSVFTPFSKAWKARPERPALAEPPAWLPAAPADLLSLPPPAAPALGLFPPGEAEARRRLDDFAAGPIYAYADRRDRLDYDGSARLSPYLRLGMLSAGRAVAAARRAIQAAPDAAARAGAETWLNELIWREFYLHLLYHYPQARRENFRPLTVRWQNDPAAFAAWRDGRTGYPVVDAAMRQLAALGWMHNRARMIAASFLTKDLLIDWRWGERVFMQRLIDADPASNSGGWQWCAGTGADAAPYFRIFNPLSQGLKHDPQGDYVRAWLPELRRTPGEYIHQPWTMPPDVQRQAGCIIGQDYPPPIVDHAQARQRALEAYARQRLD